MNGYHGNVLRVDLTTGETLIETPNDNLYRQYFGGQGLIAQRVSQAGAGHRENEGLGRFRADGATRPWSGESALDGLPALREGFRRADDTLPQRFFAPLTGGKLEGVSLDRTGFDRALTGYYRMMGCDYEGRPF